MYAVVGSVSIEPGRAEEAQSHLENTTVPRVKEVPGVISGVWTRSSDGQHGAAIIVFESEEAARAAAEQAPKMVPEFVHFDSIEVREVVAQI
jgi:heme-degrading monooxygenase HmoA